MIHILLHRLPGILFAVGVVFTNNITPAEIYQCMPCGQSCDNEKYNSIGNCRSCHMELVKKSDVKFKTISPDQLCNYIAKNPDVVLLDVRSREEFAGDVEPELGRIKNAINIPVQELETRIKELNNVKNKEIIVYCSRSHRSPRASFMLNQHGFTKVTNMQGGLSVMKDKRCIN